MTAGNEPRDVWTDVRFWQQVAQDAKRTVVVAPGIEQGVRDVIERAGMTSLYTVRASELAPENQVLIIDEQAMATQLYRTFHQL